MGKRLTKLLLLTGALLTFSATALADETQATETTNAADGQAVTSEQTGAKEMPGESADGSYKFQPSWGIGVQYGMTYTSMENWNEYLLKRNMLNYYKANFIADHELYLEGTFVEGFRLSLFGGWTSLYLKNTGFNMYTVGLEPAFSVRRYWYEFAVGLGVAGGMYQIDSNLGDLVANRRDKATGYGLLLRPFVEGRVYPGTDYFALYLRLGFTYFKSLKLDLQKNEGNTNYRWDGTDRSTNATGTGQPVEPNKLVYSGPYAAAGLRFGYFPYPMVSVGDQDGDGIHDDVDACVTTPGTAEYFGCPNPDKDGDKVCEAWVVDTNNTELFKAMCVGKDDCPDVAGTAEFNGCPNPDQDGDGICDPWVEEKGMSAQFANVCTGSDKCATEAEDKDGFEDQDGCPDPDNDKDKICDPWVAKQGLSDKYNDVCSAEDLCPNMAGTAQFKGCPNPDADSDGFCEEFVYQKGLDKVFMCKGLDKCPNEVGDDEKGCKHRRVEVTEKEIRINDTIYFALNKAIIKKQSDSLIQEIADVFQQNPQIKKVEIQGHTDFSGSFKHNMKLSQARAKAVYARLVKLGVAKDRMTYKGYGYTMPVVPKTGKKERPEDAALNRRVNFIILEQTPITKVTVVDGQTQPTQPTQTTTQSGVATTTTKKTTVVIPGGQTAEKTAAQIANKVKQDPKKAAAIAKAEAQKAEAEAKKAAREQARKAKEEAKKAAAAAKAEAKKAAAAAKAEAKKAKAGTKKIVGNAKATAAAKAAAAKAAAKAAAAKAAGKK